MNCAELLDQATDELVRALEALRAAHRAQTGEETAVALWGYYTHIDNAREHVNAAAAQLTPIASPSAKGLEALKP